VQKYHRSFIAVLTIIQMNNAFGEVALDGSLGPSGALPGPNFPITYELGRQVGGNLFHSFSAFNINAGESATFSGPGTINNIISRVTGPGSSTIDGPLQSTIPGANLYLMNPNGVLFGPGGKLDISGSFHMTTANSIALGADGLFAASLGENSVLTASQPSAFRFTSAQPRGISVDDTVLQVNDGKELSVIGGDIVLRNGRLLAKSGNIRMASLASPGEVIANAQGVAVVNVDHLGTIEITDSRPFDGVGNLDVAGDLDKRAPSGNIYIRSGELKSYGGFFHSNTFGSVNGGVTSIKVDGNVLISANTFTNETGKEFTKSTTIQNDAALGTGNAGEIIISSGSVQINGPLTGISSDGNGAGNSGNIVITTGDLVMEDGARIASIVGNTGIGGDIRVTANTVTMTGSAALRTNISGVDKAGNIIINAGSLRMEDLATLDASVRPGAEGDGGTVSIRGDALLIRSAPNENGLGAKIAVDTFGPGNGGDIDIKVNSVTLLDQAVIEANSRTETSGTAGNISLTEAAQVRIENGSSISTQTEEADGGNINVQATDLVYLRDAEITTSVGGGQGNGGNITIDPTFVVLSTSKIIANASGGNGGNISITADNLIASSGSRIQASSQLGIDGTINVSAPENNVSSGISTLPENFQDPGELLQEGCGRRTDVDRSTFGVAGKGGFPAAPGDYLTEMSSIRGGYSKKRAARVSINSRRMKTASKQRVVYMPDCADANSAE